MASGLLRQEIFFALVFRKTIIRNTEKREIMGIAIRGLSSKHEQRTPKTYKTYTRIIRHLINKYGKPALILAPGYDFAKEIAKMLKVRVVKDPGEASSEVVVSVLRGDCPRESKLISTNH